MPSREKRLINIKTGVVIFLVLAICATLILTVVRVANTLENNKTLASQADTGIKVETGFFSIKITFASSIVPTIFEDETPEAYIQRVKLQNGVKKAQLNPNGVIVLTATREYHKAMLSEIRTHLEQTLNEYVKSGTYLSFTELAFSSDMAKFTIKVNRATFEAGSDSSVSTPIGTSALYYRALSGDENPQVQVIFVDSETGETIQTDTYPSAA